MVWVIRRGGRCWWVGGRCGERRVKRWCGCRRKEREREGIRWWAKRRGTGRKRGTAFGRKREGTARCWGSLNEGSFFLKALGSSLFIEVLDAHHQWQMGLPLLSCSQPPHLISVGYNLDGVGGHSLHLDNHRGRQLLFVTLSAAPHKSKIHLDSGNPSQQGYSVGIWVKFHLLSIIRVEKHSLEISSIGGVLLRSCLCVKHSLEITSKVTELHCLKDLLGTDLRSRSHLPIRMELGHFHSEFLLLTQNLEFHSELAFFPLKTWRLGNVHLDPAFLSIRT
ncbi:hypothetical protein RJT34_13156 [Clitoria ternatea]|uniref:Uncharacterized protein n=1 Tax=Clitoria ternatea TaxID=43366 RepID=A0AAN9PL68_CLITE